MNAYYQRMVWLVLTLFFSAQLSGCATDAQRTRTEGATAGAIGGAILGKLLGGDRKSAEVGAALGGAIGLMVGDSVAKRKEDYANHEAALQAAADKANQAAEQGERQNALLSQEIANLNERVQRLQTAKLSADSRRQAAIESDKAKTALLARVDEQLSQVRAALAEQQTVIDRENARVAAATSSADTPSADKPGGLSRLFASAQAAAPRSAAAPAPTTSPQLMTVSASSRSLRQQESALERARAQLEQIDPRRQY